MFAAREVDFAKDTYEPLYHGPYILKKIVDFKTTASIVDQIDNMTEKSALAVAVFLALTSASTFYWLVLAATFYLGKDQVGGRSEHRQKFLDQLAELQTIYKWCIETGDKKVTEDGVFLELLDAIFPFTRDIEKLLLAKPDQEYSDLFKKIMSQPPHYVQFEEKKRGFAFPSLSIPWFFQSTPITPVQLKKEPQPQLNYFAHYRLWRYGEQKPQENKPLPEIAATAATTLVNNLISK